MAGRLGVCSWSLRPASPAELADRVRAAGFDAVQLHLDPLRTEWDEAETIGTLRDAGIGLLSGMMTMEGEDYTSLASIRETGGVRPDATWAANLEAAHTNAELAHRLGLELVTFHAGWIPHDRADPERGRIIERVAELERVFGACSVRIGLETGQETASTLLEVLEETPGVGVNFDPANMILYGMGDPHEALERLGARVVQLHLKDAKRAHEAGAWGEEVPLGAGEVDWTRLLSIASRVCPGVGMAVEREAGERRVEDVRAARGLIESIRKG